MTLSQQSSFSPWAGCWWKMAAVRTKSTTTSLKDDKMSVMNVELTLFETPTESKPCFLPFYPPAVSPCTWRTKATWRWRCLRRQPKAIRGGAAWGHRRPSPGTLGSCVSCRASQRGEKPRSCSSRLFCPQDSASSTARASSLWDKRTGTTVSAL